MDPARLILGIAKLLVWLVFSRNFIRAVRECLRLNLESEVRDNSCAANVAKKCKLPINRLELL